MNACKTDPTQWWALLHPLPFIPLDLLFLHITPETCVRVCVSSHLIMSDLWFPVYFLSSFIAFYLQHSNEGYWEIAPKWFIIWLTFTTCIHFCACECVYKTGGSEWRGRQRRANFLVLISQLALNQGSKVGLAQHLWQDKHLFLCWHSPELSYYPQYVNLSKSLYTHE